jgi:N-acetylglutamate synthase
MSARELPSRPTADAVGKRVVVRRTLNEDERGPRGERMTDVVGVLERLEENAVVVRRRDEESVRIPLASVVAWKTIPAQAVPKRDVQAVELAAARAWRGVDRAVLGDWQLRAADGFTARANSCLPIGDPGVALPAAVDAVVEWYVARGLPPRFQVPSRLADALDGLLEAQGWIPSGETTVVTGRPAKVLDVVAATTASPDRVDVTDHLTDHWLALYLSRGHSSSPPPIARSVLRDADGPVSFAHAYVAGVLVAIARGAVTADPGGRRWLGVSAVAVMPAYRRSGLARQLFGTLTEWGLAHGAAGIYVQVGAGNVAALRLYERLGLTEHHRYHYRRPAPTQSGAESR